MRKAEGKHSEAAPGAQMSGTGCLEGVAGKTGHDKGRNGNVAELFSVSEFTEKQASPQTKVAMEIYNS